MLAGRNVQEETCDVAVASQHVHTAEIYVVAQISSRVLAHIHTMFLLKGYSLRIRGGHGSWSDRVLSLLAHPIRDCGRCALF